MQKKMCPYCDQTINGMYCRGCRRIVWKPQVWEVDYYLNERHPGTEANCQYHGDLHTGEMAARKKNGAGTQSRQAPARKTVTRERAAWEPAASRKRKAAPVFSRRGKAIAILTAAAVYMIFTGIGMRNSFRYHEVGKGIPEPRPETAPESYGADAYGGLLAGNASNEIYEYSDEDVIAAGIPCSGSGHLGITDREFCSRFEQRLGEAFEFTVSSYSINQSLDQTTWFDTQYAYGLYSDGEDCGYIVLSFDTVDRSFHSLVMMFDTADAMSEAMGALIPTFYELGLPEGPDNEIVFPEAAELSEGEAWESELFEGLWAYCSRDGDGGYVIDMYAALPDGE